MTNSDRYLATLDAALEAHRIEREAFDALENARANLQTAQSRYANAKRASEAADAASRTAAGWVLA